MKIKNEISIAAAPDIVWAAMDDVPRIAKCAPGAELLEQKADGTCIGRIMVKLGPVSLQFKGSLSFERDDENRRVFAKAKGAEEKARGSANADVIFQLQAAGEGTRIIVDSDITLAGFIAQYGRGAALIQSTAQSIMNQFARNLEVDLNGGEPAAHAKDLLLTKAIAQGLWSAGTGVFRKKDSSV